MNTEFDVAIFFRNECSYKPGLRVVSLDTIIPEMNVWEFVDGFRESFGTYDDELGPLIKMVHGDVDDWHVKLTIRACDEEKFDVFLRSFCRERTLKFLEPPHRI